jgi:N,N'-diacetyllegionaminate synthase
MSKKVSLNGRLVGDGEPVYIIAEGGLSNWGRLDLAKQQVDAAMAAGCDAVKFQAQMTEALVSKVVDPYWYRRLKYKELSHDDLRKLWDYCSVRNIQCFITAHTEVDHEFLDKELDQPFFKVGSGESVNFEFLEKVGATKKPVIMSLGMHLDNEEIKESVRALERGGTTDIVLLHCNTVYPTPPNMNDLSMIGRLKKMFDYPVGYSDHTVGWHLVLAAVALGATVIEKHLSFDTRDKRSFDCPGSVTPETIKDMVDQIRDIEAAMSDRQGLRAEHLKKGRKWARQSITATRDISKGTAITRKMLALKRPGTGLGPDRLSDVVGKKASRDIGEDEFILEADVT